MIIKYAQIPVMANRGQHFGIKAGKGKLVDGAGTNSPAIYRITCSFGFTSVYCETITLEITNTKSKRAPLPV